MVRNVPGRPGAIARSRSLAGPITWAGSPSVCNTAVICRVYPAFCGQ